MKVSALVSVWALAAQLVSSAPADMPQDFENVIRRNIKRMEAEGGLEVRGAGWHHERHLQDVEGEMKRRGIPLEKRQRVRGAENNGVRLRREIRQLEALTLSGRNVKPIDLFMLAMAAWYTAGDRNNKLSYWQIAGIHGQPFQSYGTDGQNVGPAGSGYCTHGSTLFPPWHRPYLALVEEQIFNIAKGIANGARYQKYDWLAALNEVRLPYYDPGNNANYPNILRQSRWTIPRDPNTGQQRVIDNPLYAHRFPFAQTYQNFITYIESGGVVRYNKPWFRQMQTTRRCPTQPLNGNSAQDDGRVAAKIWAQRSQLRSRTRQLLLGNVAKTWDQMSNRLGSGDSLESLHDILHVEIGENGHMTEVWFSSFDPIFWLHHANIDRLFAMWQRINPGVGPGSRRNGGGTYGIPPNTIEDGNTRLRPFRPWLSEEHWTGNTVRDWRVFGYDYADAPNQGWQRARQIAEQLYPNSIQAAAAAAEKRSLMRRGEYIGDNLEISNNTIIPITEDVIDGIEKSVKDNKYSEWRIDCSVDRTAVGESFSVRFFKGRPPKDPRDWAIAENLLGSYQVMGHHMIAAPGIDPATVDNQVSGTVPITEPLMANLGKDELHSLNPEDVIEWCIKNLRWRVEANGVRIPVRKVKGLSVKISRAESTLKDDGPVVTGKFVEVGAIVRKIGKEGGDLAPGVLPPSSEHATEEDLAEARRLGKI